MKIIYSGLAALVLMGSVFSVSANEVKIGYVNTERVLHDSAPAAKAEKKIEKEFAARQMNLQKMAKQAKDIQNFLERENVTITDAERASKEKELANLNRDFQRLQREFREDLNQRKNEELASILDKANKVIMNIAETEKFDLILQEAVYHSAKLDITDKVIKALAADK